MLYVRYATSTSSQVCRASWFEDHFFLFQNPNATISRPTQDFRNNQKLLFALFIALSNLLDLFPCPECSATILQQVTVDNHNTFFYDTSLKP